MGLMREGGGMGMAGSSPCLHHRGWHLRPYPHYVQAVPHPVACHPAPVSLPTKLAPWGFWLTSCGLLEAVCKEEEEAEISILSFDVFPWLESSPLEPRLLAGWEAGSDDGQGWAGPACVSPESQTCLTQPRKSQRKASSPLGRLPCVPPRGTGAASCSFSP